MARADIRSPTRRQNRLRASARSHVRPLASAFEDRLGAMVRRRRRRRPGRLEPPVGPLAVRSGQIGLDGFADEIVELGMSEDRARAADERMDGGGDGVGERRIFVWAESMKPAATRAAIRPRFSSRRWAISSPALARVKRPSDSRSAMSAPLPPASERRQIMGGDAGDRHRRIGRRWPDLRAVALEPQHPHALDVGARHAGRGSPRHSAEVLADHHAAARWLSSAIWPMRSSSG